MAIPSLKYRPSSDSIHALNLSIIHTQKSGKIINQIANILLGDDHDRVFTLITSVLYLYKDHALPFITKNKRRYLLFEKKYSTGQDGLYPYKQSFHFFVFLFLGLFTTVKLICCNTYASACYYHKHILSLERMSSPSPNTNLFIFNLSKSNS